MPEQYDPYRDPSVMVPVDENGLRLAPDPVKKSDTNVLPKAVQPFEFQPKLRQVSGPEGSSGSTIDDFQPKKRDQSKRIRRTKRNRNIFAGVIMLLVTAAVALPFILGSFGLNISKPFIFSLQQYNVFGSIVKAIQNSIGQDAATLKTIWMGMIPSMILFLGIIGLLTNFIKSFIAILGGVRPVRYVASAMFYLITVLIVFIMALVGVNAIGVARIDFIQDFIYKFYESEYFTLLAFAVVNLIIAIILRIANPDKSGYLKHGV